MNFSNNEGFIGNKSHILIFIIEFSKKFEKFHTWLKTSKELHALNSHKNDEPVLRKRINNLSI